MQQVKVQRFKWCDICFQEREEYEEAIEFFRISISDNGRTELTRQVDTCEVHSKTVRDLRELIKVAGIVPKKATARQRQLDEEVEEVEEEARPRNVCPDCELELKAFGVPSHLVRIHGYAPIKQPMRCPDCRYTAASENGMRVHRIKVHDYDLIADLMEQRKKRRGRR